MSTEPTTTTTSLGLNAGPWRVRLSQFHDLGDNDRVGIVGPAPGPFGFVVLAEVFADEQVPSMLGNAYLMAAARDLYEFACQRAAAGDARAHALVRLARTGVQS